MNTEFQRKKAVEPVGGIRCLMCFFMKLQGCLVKCQRNIEVCACDDCCWDASGRLSLGANTGVFWGGGS